MRELESSDDADDPDMIEAVALSLVEEGKPSHEESNTTKDWVAAPSAVGAENTLFEDLDYLGDISDIVEDKCYCKGGQKGSCSNLCPSLYGCGVHYCPLLCHPDPCGPCPYSPEEVQNCQCGKFTLNELPVIKRNKCTDFLPLCSLRCDKPYGCGHKCPQLCHAGPCPPCTGVISVKCRCGKGHANVIECANLGTVPLGGFSCHRRCQKKLSCLIHRAVQI